jgi:hypothetical protein
MRRVRQGAGGGAGGREGARGDLRGHLLRVGGGGGGTLVSSRANKCSKGAKR